MKVEDLLQIVKRELAKVGMMEHIDDSGSLESILRSFHGETKPSRFEYQNLRLASYKKIDNK
jgi:hypothetical protein